VDLWVAAAAIAVLAAGASLELADGLDVRPLLDWTIGAGFTAAAARRPFMGRTARRTAELALGLGTAALWFAATGAAHLPPQWQGTATVLTGLTVIGYRGPLLHWLVRQADAPRRGTVLALLAVGYAGALTGTRGSAVATAATALALAVVVAATARSRRDDARRVARATAVVLAALGLVWASAATGLLPSSAGVLLDTVVLLGAVVLLGGPAASRGLSGAVGSLVVELGPSSRQRAPVSATLARALADPQLHVRAYAPDTGWTDEFGRPVSDPVAADPDRVTLADGPDGGRVALVHGEPGAADGPLARAAATAALLALESVRLEANVRREATAVRESTARLVTVDEEERRALSLRLQTGPLSRLERLQEAMVRGDDELTPVTEELDRVIRDLGDLAAGLDPGGIGTDGLTQTLRRLCEGMGLPVALHVSHDADSLPADSLPADSLPADSLPADSLPADLAALAYFVTAEALTNVVRHAAADHASVTLDVSTHEVLLTIEDDGRGGAVVDAGRGVQGLIDRVEFAGGRLTLDSPSGGPTRLVARVPLREAPAAAPSPPRHSG
jgi:signal transduction histidine kinase